MKSSVLVQMIKLALSNSLTKATINSKMSDWRVADELLYGDILHKLQHFVEDEDIRSRDSEYDKQQRTQLEAALSRIDSLRQ